MNVDLYIAFVAISCGLILFPGPNVLLTVSNSLAGGRRRRLRTVAGTSSAMAVQLALVTLGTTSAMLILSQIFERLRWCGVVYLVWLGAQRWREPPDRAACEPIPDDAPGRAYRQGFVVSLTNPKTLLFFAAFLPQFVDPAGHALAQMTFLSGTFLALATVLDAAYALATNRLRARLMGRRAGRPRNRIEGSLLVGAGAGLALAGQK